MENILSNEELHRYARHIAIPSFGLAGQEKLKRNSVLVIGAGGLGSPLLLYLAAAGVGHIGIVDFDKVDISNLQRQVLYTMDDVGKYKSELAAKRLKSLNPHIKVSVFNSALTKENALSIIAQFDIVADGTDNFPTRYLINDACVIAKKTYVYASIFRFEGQISVFNYLNNDGSRGPNYRHLFPEPPPAGLVPNCAEGGVLGVLPGIIGSIQASEVIKVLTGLGEPLVGKLFIFDVAAFQFRTLKINASTEVIIDQLIDYQQFCNPNKKEHDNKIQEITVAEFMEWQKKGVDYQLIDVREAVEYEVFNLKGRLIPLSILKSNLNQINLNKKVVIHCKTGLRSSRAIEELQQLYPFKNLYNLKGGLVEYTQYTDQ